MAGHGHGAGRGTGVRVSETPDVDDAPMTSRDCFSKDSPDVVVTGVGISRATITTLPRSKDDDAAEREKPFQLHWHISGLAVQQDPADDEGDRLTLVGDLVCREKGWFVGATATCSLAFRNADDFDPDNDDAFDAKTKTLGTWASNILYDTAAAAGRMMVAATPGCTMDVPIATPRPHITRRRRRSSPEGSETAQADAAGNSAPV